MRLGRWWVVALLVGAPHARGAPKASAGPAKVDRMRLVGAPTPVPERRGLSMWLKDGVIQLRAQGVAPGACLWPIRMDRKPRRLGQFRLRRKNGGLTLCVGAGKGPWRGNLGPATALRIQGRRRAPVYLGPRARPFRGWVRVGAF